ncbi:uncharacterized protein LOC107044885 isoform X1 [Diachasma alloeum]|uniref:uncharacterized protein LOC107044885 isoform X1 n=1 Tax=Diachasma alloeum TaxID=454923 RepID=UPI0007381852|nr:uncharacterized protein LOC107044885 isoform X1 [Diachasma alloeum]XP_015122431.1 uncharacterized protein LOC107044885 isoform X1 [Diachasma alloeum]
MPNSYPPYIYRTIPRSTQNLGRINEKNNSKKNNTDIENSDGRNSHEKDQEDYSSLELSKTTTAPKNNSSKMMKIEDENSKTLKVENEYVLKTIKSESHAQRYSSHIGEVMSKLCGKQMDDIGNASPSSIVTLSNMMIKKSKTENSYEKLITLLKSKVDEEIDEKLGSGKSTLDNEGEISSCRNSNLLSSYRVVKMAKRIKPLYRESLTTTGSNETSTENEEDLTLTTPLLQVPADIKFKQHSPYTTRISEPKSITTSSIVCGYSSNKQGQIIQPRHAHTEETQHNTGNGLQYVSDRKEPSISETGPTSITDNKVMNLKNAENLSQEVQSSMSYRGEQQFKKLNNSKSLISNEARAGEVSADSQMELQFQYSNEEIQTNQIHQISGRTIPSELSIVMESLNETNETNFHQHRCPHYQIDLSATSHVVNCEKETIKACSERVKNHKRYCRKKKKHGLEIYAREMNIQVACGWGCSGPCVHRRLCVPKSYQRKGLHDFRRYEYLCGKNKRASKRNDETLDICYLS